MKEKMKEKAAARKAEESQERSRYHRTKGRNIVRTK